MFYDKAARCVVGKSYDLLAISSGCCRCEEVSNQNIPEKGMIWLLTFFMFLRLQPPQKSFQVLLYPLRKNQMESLW